MTQTPTIVVVDASAWVSRLVPQNAHHEASKRWLDEFSARKGKCVAPALLLLEVAGAISRRTGEPSLAHQAVKQMQRPGRLCLVAIDRRLGQTAARLAADLGLRGRGVRRRRAIPGDSAAHLGRGSKGKVRQSDSGAIP